VGSGTPPQDTPNRDAPRDTAGDERGGAGERADQDPSGERGSAHDIDAGQRQRGSADPRAGDPTSTGDQSTAGDEPARDRSGAGSQGAENPASDQAGQSEASNEGATPDGDPQANREQQAGRGSDGAPQVPPRAGPSDPSSAGGSQSGDSSEPSSSATDSGKGRPPGEPSDGQPALPGAPASDGPSQASRTPGGGQSSGTSADETAGGDEANAADEANLEYTRRATDLALRHLKDDRHRADLQERLGWSPEEVEAFLRRWEQMQREARQSGPQGEQARRRLSDQLRGLGLQPQAERVRGSQTRKDDLRSLRQSSNVPIPAEYLEQYRAFLKSVPSQEPPRSAAPQR
jgi:hypothetical protein